MDQARSDFAAIEVVLDFIKAQVARLRTRGDLTLTALRIIIATSALVIVWIEGFLRHCL